MTSTASTLMAADPETMGDRVAEVLEATGRFFSVDTVFLRRNDHVARVTRLVDEWPRRENVPDPDPIAVVPFDADPVFGATEHLLEPLISRPEAQDEGYRDRIESGSGVPEFSMATVPLLRSDRTEGVLGLVHFGDRPWTEPETNALVAIASLLMQVVRRVEAEQAVRAAAFSDPLTGLANRAGLLDALDRRIADGDAGLVVLDLDQFTSVNDLFGMRFGDEVLRSVADRLVTGLREGDVAARIGADEFAVALLAGGGPEAVMVADRLRELLRRPFTFGETTIELTASVGVVSDEGAPSTEADEALGHAAAALKEAKATGDVVMVYDAEMRERLAARSRLELELRHAVRTGEGLVLHYQPEIDLVTGELLAVEALARWDHPTRGLLPAGAFIGVAEESGLVVELSNGALGAAVAQMAAWRELVPGLDLAVRVNVSPAQFVSTDLVGLVRSALTEHGLPAHHLCLEVTEHVVVTDMDRTVQVAGELRAMGVTIALDDFGTGHSSMAQLRNLPFDSLKIDRAFVSGLGVHDTDVAIVASMMTLAEVFGLDVVAEGIELEREADVLRGLGCRRAQGYLFARPVPAAEIEELLLGRGERPWLRHLPVARR